MSAGELGLICFSEEFFLFWFNFSVIAAFFFLYLIFILDIHGNNYKLKLKADVTTIQIKTWCICDSSWRLWPLCTVLHRKLYVSMAASSCLSWIILVLSCYKHDQTPRWEGEGRFLSSPPPPTHFISPLPYTSQHFALRKRSFFKYLFCV